MPWKNILKLIMSHPQFGPHIINRLADSRPIRWAAKLTASMYLRGKYSIEQKLKDPRIFINDKKTTNQNNYSSFSGNRFKDRFIKELQREWKKSIQNKQK